MPVNNSDICSSSARCVPACHIPAGPCPLQVVAAAHAVHIQDLSCEIQSRHKTGFQCLRIHLCGIDPSAADLCLVKRVRPGDCDAEAFDQAAVQKVATLADANKTAINAIIAALKAAGIMATS